VCESVLRAYEPAILPKNVCLCASFVRLHVVFSMYVLVSMPVHVECECTNL
jgi:hypothetical protein